MNRFKTWLIAFGIFIAALFAAWFKGKGDGKTELIQDDLEEANKILQAEPEELTDEYRRKRGWLRNE